MSMILWFSQQICGIDIPGLDTFHSFSLEDPEKQSE